MKKPSGRTVAVNVLGALGYMGTLVSWLLLLAVFFVLLANSPFIAPPQQAIKSSVSVPASLSGAALFASYGVTIVAVIVSVCIFITLPYFMGRGMSRLLRRILGVVKLPPTGWHLWLLKAFVTAIPCVGFLAMTLFGMHGDTVVPLFVVVFFASLFSVGLFSLQHLLAWRLKLVPSALW